MPLPAWNLEVPVGNEPGHRSHRRVGAGDEPDDDRRAGRGLRVAEPRRLVRARPTSSRTTSTLNVVRAVQTLPNHATVAVSARGFDVFTQSGGHLVADVAGYYLGTPVPAPFGTPSNTTRHAGRLPRLSRPAPVAAVVSGSSAATVARAQQRLLDLGFWNAGADGNYGWSTSQAVMAFQKWMGLANKSGNLDETTAAALNGNRVPPDARHHVGRPVRGGQGQAARVHRPRRRGPVGVEHLERRQLQLHGQGSEDRPDH